ncbi:hypothetical protein [Ruminococcus sp. AM31-15AC]|uniref:hypothetical protein n=1 Tax=Ruminococcus sp. AM31-15AC TaxID=2293202 RepID=UPI002095A743
MGFAPAECGRTDEIPVRKIELYTDTLTLDKDNPEITVKYKALPANSDYAENIEFRVTNEKGITSNLAECDVTADGVRVKAKGDGSFWLRAMCKNGTDRYHIISVLKFTARGLGSALTDPYQFVIGGLFTRASDNVSSGMKKGVGFAMGRVTSWAAYDNLDFGSAGSDTVTVQIWANTLDPVKISFYDGIPDESGKLLGTFSYHKEPEWMIFKPETFKLSRKLKGIETLCILTEDGFQVGGFNFEKESREFAVNNATDADNIYGDKFTKGEKCVTEIGNNVMLDFGEFDFSKKQPSRLVISGKSPLSLNSIHLILNGSEGENRILCEFRTDDSENYAQKSFDISGISGKQKVSFAFLPGSNFDFEYFRFE